MRKNNKKIILSSEELEDIIHNAIEKYLNSLRIETKSGRIDGEIPDISEFASKLSYANNDLINQKDEFINEGLIHTYDIEKVKDMVCRKFDLLPNQFHIEKRYDNNVITDICMIILKSDISNNFIGEIKHFMQTCGYFEAFKKRYLKNNIVLTFEPRFSKDISNEIKNKYENLFHATPTIYVEKILRNGLVPKNNNTLFFYPSRIYCMRGNNLSNSQINVLKNVQKQRLSNNHFDNNEYTILKIETSKLSDNIKFYVDPMAPDAIFTYDNIPPQAITISSKL